MNHHSLQKFIELPQNILPTTSHIIITLFPKDEDTFYTCPLLYPINLVHQHLQTKKNWNLTLVTNICVGNIYLCLCVTVADPDLELRGGGGGGGERGEVGFDLVALLAFLPSMISSFSPLIYHCDRMCLYVSIGGNIQISVSIYLNLW